jgi:hypothetical protein
MLDALVEQVRGWIDEGVDPISIGVTARTNRQVEAAKGALDSAGLTTCSVVAMVGWLAGWSSLGWLIAAYLPIRWLSVAAHECGHIIGARLGGLTVRFVMIGSGPSRRFCVGETKVMLGLWPMTGFVLPAYPRYSCMKRSAMLMLVGGPLTTMVLLVGLLTWRPGPVGWIGVVAQVTLLINTLALMEGHVSGLEGQTPTDGLSIFRLLTLPDAVAAHHQQWLAVLDRPDASPAEKLAAATALANDPDLHLSLLPNMQGMVAYFVAVLGITERYDEADRLSTEVVAQDPSDANLDTRGCVLTMLGAGLEAVPMLERGLIGIEELGLGDEELGWCHSFLAKAHLDAGAEDEARTHAVIAAELGVSIPALREVQERLASPTE